MQYTPHVKIVFKSQMTNI